MAGAARLAASKDVEIWTVAVPPPGSDAVSTVDIAIVDHRNRADHRSQSEYPGVFQVWIGSACIDVRVNRATTPESLVRELADRVTLLSCDTGAVGMVPVPGTLRLVFGPDTLGTVPNVRVDPKSSGFLYEIEMTAGTGSIDYAPALETVVNRGFDVVVVPVVDRSTVGTVIDHLVAAWSEPRTRHVVVAGYIGSRDDAESTVRGIDGHGLVLVPVHAANVIRGPVETAIALVSGTYTKVSSGVRYPGSTPIHAHARASVGRAVAHWVDSLSRSDKKFDPLWRGSLDAAIRSAHGVRRVDPDTCTITHVDKDNDMVIVHAKYAVGGWGPWPQTLVTDVIKVMVR